NNTTILTVFGLLLLTIACVGAIKRRRA
ncbi:LPXTG cell wall anchor domain-containing protein, partial [Enterococcus sp. S181_ASV_20]|nr:LPXTG cell wall anchor domain-containing protein [Enterococcus sp. S181_ASV_20]